MNPLSARSGEREGPVAPRREGEVFIRCTISLVSRTHLTRSLRSHPLPPQEQERAERVLLGVETMRACDHIGHGCTQKATAAQGLAAKH